MRIGVCCRSSFITGIQGAAEVGGGVEVILGFGREGVGGGGGGGRLGCTLLI